MLGSALIFKLALRNLARHRIRTIVILTMIIGAFTAVVIFRGFSNAVLANFEENITQGTTGHLQIATKAIWNNDVPKDKASAYIDKSEALVAEIENLPETARAAGREYFYALLSATDTSIGVIAFGFDPVKEKKTLDSIRIVEGEWFSQDNNEHEIMITTGVQKKLGLKVGQTISVIGQTLSGSITSADLEVRSVFKIGIEEADNNTIYLPLKTSQRLLGTDRVDTIGVVLKPGVDLESAKAKVQSMVSFNPELEVKTWRQVAVLFNQINDFYSIQNTMIETILAILVFFGILNTIGMSVYERISEIGTMRALGDRPDHIFLLFIFEGFLLGVIGAILAVPISAFVALLFTLGKFEIILPGGTVPTVIKILPTANDFMVSALVVCVTCLISVIWPVLKALRMTIVDALRSGV